MEQELLSVLDENKSQFGQDIRNEQGRIRWGKVRESDLDLDQIVDVFKEWKDEHEYLILKGLEDHLQTTVDLLDEYDMIQSSRIFRCVKASKRGNDVYRYLVNNRLKPLRDLENVRFFREEWGDKKTNVLFVTLTYDTKRCDIRTAWENVGKEFHLFMTKMSQKYGKIECFRTWESTQNGYPHAHVTIAFRDKEFPVFIHKGKDGHKSFRIPKHDKDQIDSFWHSNVDVQGVDETQGTIEELTKYITKDLCSEKGNKTNAMICYFRKQSYAITKGFVSLIKNSFAKVTEENVIEDVGSFDLIKDEMCNCNKPHVIWKFVGILSGRDLRLSPDIWVVDIKKPPEAVMELIVKESIRWRKAHPNRSGAVW